LWNIQPANSKLSWFWLHLYFLLEDLHSCGVRWELSASLDESLEENAALVIGIE
jgi:hypothetical protein